MGREEEEEEEECSVCLNVIESDDMHKRRAVVGMWASVSHLLPAFWGGEVNEQVRRAHLSLLPVALARDCNILYECKRMTQMGILVHNLSFSGIFVAFSTKS